MTTAVATSRQVPVFEIDMTQVEPVELPVEQKQPVAKPVEFGPDHSTPPEVALQFYLEDLDSAFLYQEDLAVAEIGLSASSLDQSSASLMLDSDSPALAASPLLNGDVPFPANEDHDPAQPTNTVTIETVPTSSPTPSTQSSTTTSAGRTVHLSQSDRRREQNRIASRKARKRRREEKEALKMKAQKLDQEAAASEQLREQLAAKTAQYDALVKRHQELLSDLQPGPEGGVAPKRETGECGESKRKFKLHQFQFCAEDDSVLQHLHDLKRRMFGERVTRVALALKRNSPDDELFKLCKDVFDACTEMYKVAGPCVRPLTFPELADEERPLFGNQSFDLDSLTVKQTDAMYWLNSISEFNFSETQKKSILEARDLYLSALRAVFSRRRELNEKVFQLLENAKSSDAVSLLEPTNYSCATTATKIMQDLDDNLEEERKVRRQLEGAFVGILTPQQFARMIVKVYPNMDTRPIHLANTIKLAEETIGGKKR